MACGGDATLLGQLKDLVGQIDDSSGKCCSSSPPCGPVCAPGYQGPFAQVTMTCAPPILAPTSPQPVKPLQLPCPVQCSNEMSEEKQFQTRYANFYNNYNQDYHNEGDQGCNGCKPCCSGAKRNGATVDGKSPCCEDYTKKNNNCSPPGCPTGFKPCTMKLTPPPGCHPLGVWCAQVQPCPPKPNKKVSAKYEPGPCMRPCCKHWKPKEGPCLYDKPCKAHCYNHPPGIKPSAECA